MNLHREIYSLEAASVKLYKPSIKQNQNIIAVFPRLVLMQPIIIRNKSQNQLNRILCVRKVQNKLKLGCVLCCVIQSKFVV